MAAKTTAPSFTELNDLTCEDIGGKVLFATDDWFAAAENLLKSEAPVWKEGFTDSGKWMDGWETRRKRIPGHDWCIIRLGCWPEGGRIEGLSLDTAFFTGNYPPQASIQAARLHLTDLEEELPKRSGSMMGTCASPQHMEAAERAFGSHQWETLVPMTQLNAGYQSTRLHYFPVQSDKYYTHLRLNIYPDGGIARLRTYGVMQSPPIERLARYTMEDGLTLVDLAAMENGGVCEGLSDAHYGHPRNLIKRGRGINMGDGWETARRKDRPAILKLNPATGVLDFANGQEWCRLKLGVPGVVKRIEVDTNHFKGNFPDSVMVEGRSQEGRTIVLLPPTKLGPHQIHLFDVAPLKEENFVTTHVKVVIQPDGGISRIRILGHAKPT